MAIIPMIDVIFATDLRKRPGSSVGRASPF